MTALRFDGRVVVITGAGGGLGRAYALYFSQRGAKVVVNNVGGSRSGEGLSHSAADIVVKEIRDAGGEAVADYHNVVTEGRQIVETAVQQFGRIDVLINNAGILRDKTFIKMSDEDFTQVFDVHVKGAHQVTHAAWPLMLKQGYGRILMTGSAAGLYGNYGQTNYGAAKYALAGMALSLAREGIKKNVYVNYVAPLAASRITETVLPSDILALLSPNKVAPFVAYLCHEGCQETGAMFEVGGGYVARVDYERTPGLQLTEKNLKAENILAAWNDVVDFSGHKRSKEYPKSIMDVDWVTKAHACCSSESGGGPTIADKRIVKDGKDSLKMDSMVAIISGAGGGLGRAYALALGAQGCAVVVNDLGRRKLTTQDNNKAGAFLYDADAVVAEIRAAGGTAVPDYHDIVLEAEAVVETALKIYGRVDVLINNAGILRDKSYLKMTTAEMDAVFAVHLLGSVRLTRAVLPIMKKQGFGRLIFTTSAVGLYGNFGQVNYSAAKAAILGFARSLDKELLQQGKGDIKCNVIAPNAGTAMTATVLPPDIVALLKPDLVAPLVVLLSSLACPSSGNVLEVGSGWQAAVRIRQSQWCRMEDGKELSTILSELQKGIFKYPIEASESLLTVLELIKAEKNAEGDAEGQKSSLSIEQPLVLSDLNEVDSERVSVFSFTKKDVMLYHVGLNLREAKFVYEGDVAFTVVPSFFVLPGMAALGLSADVEAFGKCWWMSLLPSRFNPALLLHGEQMLQFPKGPLDVTEGTLYSHAALDGVKRTPKGTILALKVVSFLSDKSVLPLKEIERDSTKAREKDLIKDFVKRTPDVVNVSTLFLRGLNLSDAELEILLKHCSGQSVKNEKGDSVSTPLTITQPTSSSAASGRLTTEVVQVETKKDQAIIYRLSGDLNPLHVDPEVAAMAGFSKPILHGLCTFGMVTEILTRNLAKKLPENPNGSKNSRSNLDPAYLSSFKVRFTGVVYPGELLDVHIDAAANKNLSVRVRAAVGDRLVLEGEAIYGDYNTSNKNEGSSDALSVAKKPHTESSSSGESGNLPPASLVERVQSRWESVPVEKRAAVVKKTKAVIAFYIGGKAALTLDLKHAEHGQVALSLDVPMDLQLQVQNKETLERLLLATPIPLDPQTAFMQGALKITRGNMGQAMALLPLISLLNPSKSRI